MADEKVYHEEVVNSNPNSTKHQQDDFLHHDHIAEEAIGGHSGDLPPGYYHSPAFIGTVIVSIFQSFFVILNSSTFRRHVWLRSLDTSDGCCRPIPSPSSMLQSGRLLTSSGCLSHGLLALPLGSLLLAAFRIFSDADGSSFVLRYLG